MGPGLIGIKHSLIYLSVCCLTSGLRIFRSYRDNTIVWLQNLGISYMPLHIRSLSRGGGRGLYPATPAEKHFQPSTKQSCTKLFYTRMLVKKCYHLLLEKDVILHLNQLESPSPKDALCQVWLKLAQWFWRRRFKMLSIYFRYFLPQEKGVAPHLEKINLLHPSNVFCQVCLKLAQWFWRRRLLNVVNVLLLLSLDGKSFEQS